MGTNSKLLKWQFFFLHRQLKHEARRCLTVRQYVNVDWCGRYFAPSPSSVNKPVYVVKRANESHWRRPQATNPYAGMGKPKSKQFWKQITTKLGLNRAKRSAEKILIHKIEPQVSRVKIIKGSVEWLEAVSQTRRRPMTRIRYFANLTSQQQQQSCGSWRRKLNDKSLPNGVCNSGGRFSSISHNFFS